MAFMEWSENLKLHIDSIDEQHHRLVSLINELDDAVQANHGADVLGKVLEELIDYTKTHFKYEEALLEKHGYPSFPGHKAEHDALAEKVVFMQDMFSGGQDLDTDMVLNFLKVWLQEHILDIDKQYAPFLKEKGAA